MNNLEGKYRFYLLPALSALLLQAAYPPLRLWPFGFFALVPYFYATLKTERPFKTGLYFGWLFFFINQYWIYYSLHHYGGMPVVSSMAAVMVLAFYESLYTGFFSLLTERLHKKGIAFIFSAAPVWTCLEFLRGHLLTGFPWSLAGYSQTGFLPLLQIADITSIYGVSFLVVFINSAVTEILYLKGEKKALSFRVLAVVLSLIICISYGYLRINQINQTRAKKHLKVSVVQGNIEQDVKWEPSYQDDVINTYFRLTREVIKDKAPELVIWPESALPFYYGSEKELTEKLREFVITTKTPLLTGSMLVRDVFYRDSEVYDYSVTNSAILINPNGKLTYVYDKIHLVPFGEYVPLRRYLFFFDKLVPVGIGDFKRGNVFSKGKIGDVSFCTLICFEAAFPELVRGFFRENTDLIINITNDGWFGRTTGPLQHFDIARVRAIEERSPLVRAANTGISAVVDQTGRVISKLGLFKRGVVTEEIEIKNVHSLYARYGDVFSYLCIILTGFFVVLLKVK